MHPYEENTIVHPIPILGEQKMNVRQLRWRKKDLERHIRIHKNRIAVKPPRTTVQQLCELPSWLCYFADLQ